MQILTLFFAQLLTMTGIEFSFLHLTLGLQALCALSPCPQVVLKSQHLPRSHRIEEGRVLSSHGWVVYLKHCQLRVNPLEQLVGPAGPGQVRHPCFAEMDTSASKNNPQGLNSFQGLSCALWGYPRNREWRWEPGFCRSKAGSVLAPWMSPGRKVTCLGFGSAAHSSRPWANDCGLPNLQPQFPLLSKENESTELY